LEGPDSGRTLPTTLFVITYQPVPFDWEDAQHCLRGRTPPPVSSRKAVSRTGRPISRPPPSSKSPVRPPLSFLCLFYSPACVFLLVGMFSALPLASMCGYPSSPTLFLAVHPSFLPIVPWPPISLPTAALRTKNCSKHKTSWCLFFPVCN